MAIAASATRRLRAWTSPGLVFIFLSLLTSTPLVIASSLSPYGLDAAMAEGARMDPHATNDSFLFLPSSLRKALARSAHFNTLERLAYLKTLEILLPVHVKLVGFTGDDRFQLQNQIAKYVSALHFDDQIHVIGFEPHGLSVRTKLSLDITPVDDRLADRLFQSIRSQMETSSMVMRTFLHSVPYTAVDEIIQQDLESPLTTYTIYLLNLRKQDKPYAYAYSPGDSSLAFSKCMGTLWTGKERYLWVDLTAGPVDYGPALSGEGLLPRGEFHPLAALHGSPKSQKAFMADIASLVWSATGALFRPALRIPAYFETELLVQIVHIHGTEVIDTRGIDWGSIEDTFMNDAKGLLLTHQSLRFKRYSIQYTKCPSCVSAVGRSMRSYTSRFLFENYTLIVNEYLDSKILHHLLSVSSVDLETIAGITHDQTARTLPVYVFDLEYDRPLMLDRFHQSVAFRDMVIAVRTKSVQSVSDYNCNGRHVVTQSRNLERPIVGALLQSLWGVSPTHLTWSPRHNSTLVDYTWSVGQTPFGPFSESMSLSFVQRDAAPRNVLLTSLNATVSSAMDVLVSVLEHGGEKKLLGQKRHVEFTQRWNLLRYKLDKAVSAISHFEFNEALYYIKSSDYDLFAIHTLFYQAASELEASLVCFKDPPFPWGSTLTFLMIFVGFFYAFMRRDKLFRSKRKQF